MAENIWHTSLSMNEEKVSHSVLAFDADSGDIVEAIGNSQVTANEGLGSVLLISLLLKKISRKEINVTDTMTIGKWPAKQSSPRALRLQENDKIDVYSALQASIIYNAPDAMVALAEHMANTSVNAVKALKNLAHLLEIDKQSVKNNTGRTGKKLTQQFDTLSLAKAAQHLFSNLPFVRQLLSSSYFVYKGREIKSPSSLLVTNEVSEGYFFGANHSHATVMDQWNGQNIIICVLEANNEFHRDQLIMQMKNKLSRKHKKQKVETRQIDLRNDSKKITINIFGDMYFGEFYTRRRIRKGRNDALIHYGYDYSFEKVQPLLDIGDFNIVNFEAALTHNKQSKLDKVKPFVLSGDPEKSIITLQKHSIHAVTLGNNHTMDYNVDGLNSTLNAFWKAGIAHCGAGITDEQAETPLRLRVFNRDIVIYSAYWFRRENQQKFQCYAMGSKPGVAGLNGTLMDRIKNEKRENPGAYVIVIPHWGVDFKRVLTKQKKNADQLLSSGADLIIGHGAHMLQDIQRKQGKIIVYGLGNSIFNSDGEYKRRNAPPYSLLSQIVVTKSNINLKLYPIYTNNLHTFWQPYFVDDAQFSSIQSMYTLPEEATIGKDKIGHYFLLPVG